MLDEEGEILVQPRPLRVLDRTQNDCKLAPHDRTLALELLRMTVAFTDGLFAPTVFEAARVVFPVSRLVCDVERFPQDADGPVTSPRMGAFYVRTADGRPLREHPMPAERAPLIETWYRPHHQMLTQSVEQAIADETRAVAHTHNCVTNLFLSALLHTRAWLP